MKIVDNMTTMKDNKKSNNKHHLRPKLDVSNKKTITKSNSHQIKTETKQFNLYFLKKKMVRDLSPMGLANKSTK